MSELVLNRQTEAFPILGYLTFHSIPDLSVPADQVAGLWRRNGCPGGVPDIRGCDAFRRATSGLVHGTSKLQVNGSPIRILVREVDYDKDGILRHLIVERVDKKGKRLSYEHVGDLAYSRASNTIITNVVTEAGLDGLVSQLLRKAGRDFLEFRDNHTRDTVRNFVARALSKLNNVSVIPGSPGKFVPRPYRLELESIADFFRDLARETDDPDCRMDLLPLADTDRVRETLAKSVRAEFTNRVDGLIQEFSVYLRGEREPNQTIMTKLITQATEVRAQAEEYQTLLAVRMGFVGSQLQALVDQFSAQVRRQAAETEGEILLAAATA